MNDELGASAEGSFGLEQATGSSFPDLQLQSARQIAQSVPSAGNNVVVLTEGQAIERLEADGTDLVIILTDGTKIVVPDGAIVVPQIIVAGTPIPPANVAALLVGNEPEPAAGPNPSSGGNFAVDPGDIQAAFDLGDLLPYTELPLLLERQEEVIPVPASKDDEVTLSGLDGEGPEVILDEDDLPGGSDGTGPLTFTGTFGVDAPDGLATVQINGVNVVAGGTFAGSVQVANDGIYAVTVTGWTPVFGPNGSTVIGATFNYSVTLLDNTIAHTAPNQDTISRLLIVTATDRDGSSDADNLDVRIIDDVPNAAADADSVTEDGPLVADGNVLTGTGGTDANTTDGTADVRGADGAQVTAIAFGATTGTIGSPLAGTYGTLTLNADGSYSYTLNNGNPLVQGLAAGQSLTEVFTYTLTDGDGDTATTTLTITINGADDGVVINGLGVEGGEAVVDEDDLADGSSPDAAALTRTGTFTIDAPDGLNTVTIGGVTVVNGGAFVPGQTVNTPAGLLTITGFTPLTDANGTVIGGTISYSYLLEDNTAHPATGQDSVFDSFAVVVTDTDGSNANASLDVRIIDDVPNAANDSVTQTTENQSFSIDALNNDVLGADGVMITNAARVFVSTQATQGTVTYSTTTGLFTYTPNAGAGSSSTTDSFSYTIVDNDGDVSTATVTVTLQPDSVPVVSQVVAAVDDDGLLGGNAFNTDDINANIGDLNAGVLGDTEAIFVGQLSGSFGNDGPGTYSFAGGSATLGTEAVTLSWNSATNTLTATSARGAVFTIVVDQATGQFTLTLLQNVLHSGGDNGEVAQALALTYFASDNDGDTSLGSTLTVTFGDDAPSDFNPQSTIIQDGGSLGGTTPDSSVTGTLGIAIGADTPGALSFSIANGTPVIDGNTGSPVTVGGVALRYYVDPNTGNLVATTGNSFNTGTIGFTVTLDETGTGSYQLNIFENLSNGTTTTFSDLTSSIAGNVNNRGIGADNPATLIDVLLSGTAGGATATVNTNATAIGVANQSMDGPGEFLRIDLVSNLTSGAATPTGFAYTGRETTQSFQQFVPQVQGSQAQVVSLRVYAIDTAVTQATAPDSNPVNGLGAGETIEQITTVTVTDYLTGQTSAAFNVLSLAVGATGIVGFGASVTRNADGSVTFSGLQEGDSYAIATTSDFSAVIVQAVSGSFDLGVFSIGSFNAGQDIELSFGVTLTDEDGDTAEGTIAVTVDQDGSSLVAPAALRLNSLIDGDKVNSIDDEDANAIGIMTLPAAGGSQAERSLADLSVEQRLAANAASYAAIAGMMVGLPASAMAQPDSSALSRSPITFDPVIQMGHESLAYAAGSSLGGVDAAMLLGGNAAPFVTAQYASAASSIATGMEWNSNPLDLSEVLPDSAPQQPWASEEAAFPQAIFFEGAGAPDPAMMDALLLIGSEQAAMPEAAGAATTDDLAQVQAGGDFMDALLLISGQNIGMPSDAGLSAGNLAQQTLVDALAGNVVDNLIDHFVETADTSIATKVANAEQLLGMLSHDLAGSGLASAPVLDTASIDEAAQLATIHG